MKRVTTESETENNFKLRVSSNFIENKKFIEMKTTNNVQKTILKSLAVVVSFVLISFTVSAQGFWESLLENDTFNQIAMAMVDPDLESEITNVDSKTETDAFASFLEVEVEESLELEDWMTNEANFKVALSFEPEIEEVMKVEDWMINASYFGNTAVSFETETEEVLEVEDWMLDSKNFEGGSTNSEVIVRGNYIIGKNFIYLNVEKDDPALKLESWMVSREVWKN